jgi:uncharacterized protein (UPF0335 family)
LLPFHNIVGDPEQEYVADGMVEDIITGAVAVCLLIVSKIWDTELQELNEQKKEVFAEAKGEGFDVKILKEIIKLRKQDQEERDEREGLLDLYMRAMEQAGPEKVAKAA